MSEKGGIIRKAVLSIPSDPRFMGAVRQAATAMAQLAGLTETEAHAVTLAVNEACTNVIKHAYGYKHDEEMVLTCELYADRLMFRVRDFGAKADPACIKGRDLEDVKPGGLGVHFIRGVMDEVEYDTRGKVGTELRMVKHLKSP